MSSNENQQLDSSELDLRQLFGTIWFHKFSLMIFIIVSVPVSVFFSTIIEPTYKAETVFERPGDNSTNRRNPLFSNSQGTGLISLLGFGSVGEVNDTFFSEIRSESLLKTVILNNDALDNQKFNEFCPLPSASTPSFSLGSLLILLGVSENKNPSETQKVSLQIECLNNMLEIDFDKQGSKKKSSAYKLSIESRDPDFSANLANQIVEKYFLRHEKGKEQNFQNVKKYLAKLITEAQSEFTEANNSMQSFIIKNTVVTNINPAAVASGVSGGTINLPLLSSPFENELKKEVFNLGQLESSVGKLKKAKLTLSNLNELDQDEINKAISSTEIQEVLSRTFITSLAKIDDLSAESSNKNQKIKKIVSDELRSFEEQIKAIGDNIRKKEKQTKQLMKIENRFQELAIDLSKKQLIFEGLKDQLKEKILTSGLDNIQQPVLLTRAVPPFNKESPKTKLIVVLGLMLSIFIGIAYVLLRQSFLKRIHSLGQLKNLSGFLSCYKIKYKHLDQMGIKAGGTVLSQSFFSRAMEVGKLGCIIDLSQKGSNKSLSSDFSKTVASFLETDNSKIVCLGSSPSKKLFSANSSKDFEVDNREVNGRGFLSNSIVTINFEDDMISGAEIEKIKNKYSDYNKIICALDPEIGDLAKFKFIEQCDFYILIGRPFQFDEYTYKKFSNTVWEKEKKCLGFFLID